MLRLKFRTADTHCRFDARSIAWGVSPKGTVTSMALITGEAAGQRKRARGREVAWSRFGHEMLSIASALRRLERRRQHRLQRCDVCLTWMPRRCFCSISSHYHEPKLRGSLHSRLGWRNGSTACCRNAIIPRPAQRAYMRPAAALALYRSTGAPHDWLQHCLTQNVGAQECFVCERFRVMWDGEAWFGYLRRIHAMPALRSL